MKSKKDSKKRQLQVSMRDEEMNITSSIGTGAFTSYNQHTRTFTLYSATHGTNYPHTTGQIKDAELKQMTKEHSSEDYYSLYCRRSRRRCRRRRTYECRSG